MIAGITAIFGFDVSFDVNKSILTAFLSATLGSGGMTFLGKAAVSSIFKLIPGVGSVVGGVITGATAGVLTAALGEAYMGIMTLVFNGEMSINDLATKKGRDQMAALFKQNLKRKR